MMASKRSRIREGLGELPRPFHPEPEAVDAGPEPEDLRAEAFEKGRLAGIEEARASSEKQASQLRLELSETLKALTEYQETMTEEHANSMKQLALDAASRIVRERIEADDPIAVRALKEALESAPRNGTIEARLHPEDLDGVRGELRSMIAKKTLVLHEDDQISRGGCRLTTSCGSIDATLEAATEAVEEAVQPGEKR